MRISSAFFLATILSFCCCTKKIISESHRQCNVERRAAFVLPFPVGTSYYLLQGNCSNFTHKNEQNFSYDFRMPVGTIVVAAKEGIVNKIEQSFNDGTNDPAQLNFILIAHKDSTVSRYLHITKNGALVKSGQFVKAGDTIALSGHTGVSTEPHLHFDVTGYCTKAPCQTIPFAFINAPEILLQGKTYKARSYKMRWQANKARP